MSSVRLYDAAAQGMMGHHREVSFFLPLTVLKMLTQVSANVEGEGLVGYTVGHQGASRCFDRNEVKVIRFKRPHRCVVLTVMFAATLQST